MAEKEKKYFIVNPTGTVHGVTREHASARLKLPGWRMATKAEVIALTKEKGEQTTKKRIAAPWQPMVEPEPDLEPQKEA